jgi:hypothetical protein
MLFWFYFLLASCLLSAAGSAVYSPPRYQGMYGQGINLPLTRVRRPRPQVDGGVLTSDVSITNSHE